MPEEIWQRNPRPQYAIPTKVSRIDPDVAPLIQVPLNENPWKYKRISGTLIQGNNKWHMTVQNGALGLTKKVEINTGNKQLQIMRLLNSQNIHTIQEAFVDQGEMYICFSYYRFTLEEVLHVHESFEEDHIIEVSRSIFNAVKHVATAGIVHNSVTPAAIRICGKSGKVVLSNFEDCILQNGPSSSNIDLQQLGFTILECMNGNTDEKLRKLDYVISQRNNNKIFGIKKSEKWSGCKLLIDCLDDLFNDDKQPLAKFERPHAFLRLQHSTDGILLLFTELVTLECFARWRAAPRGNASIETS